MERSWQTWRAHFERNQVRPLPSIEAPDVAMVGRAEVARSLAIFQLGETGEGRIVHQIRQASVAGIDDDYKEALRLFIAEEGRHARILGRMLQCCGGEPRTKNWTAGLFVVGRRAMGVRLKLLCMLAAEVVGICFYGAIARKIGEGSIAEGLRQLVEDESNHLDFHVDFFRTQTPSALSRVVFALAWWPISMAACVVVGLDHRRTLAVLGVSRRALAREIFELVSSVDRSVGRNQPAEVARAA